MRLEVVSGGRYNVRRKAGPPFVPPYIGPILARFSRNYGSYWPKGVSPEWREVKGGLGLSAVAATVLRKNHRVTGFSQEVVVFWAPLFCSWFTAIGTERDLIGGNSKQQSVEQLVLASWLGVSGVHSVGKVMICLRKCGQAVV